MKLVVRCSWCGKSDEEEEKLLDQCLDCQKKKRRRKIKIKALSLLSLKTLYYSLFPSSFLKLSLQNPLYFFLSLPRHRQQQDKPLNRLIWVVFDRNPIEIEFKTLKITQKESWIISNHWMLIKRSKNYSKIILKSQIKLKFIWTIGSALKIKSGPSEHA